MIELKKGIYYDLLFFAEIEGGDVMGCLYKEDSSDEWVVKFRRRLYNSEDPFDGKDTKRWYELSSPTGFDKATARQGVEYAIRKLTMHDRPDIKFKIAYVEGDHVKCMEVLKRQDYAHFAMGENE
jgi:hypothetical protein